MTPHHPGDDKYEPDPPPYPREWGYEQRTTAYWQAVRTGFPRHTSGWYGLLAQAEHKHDHIGGLLAQEQMDYE